MTFAIAEYDCVIFCTVSVVVSISYLRLAALNSFEFYYFFLLYVPETVSIRGGMFFRTVGALDSSTLYIRVGRWIAGITRYRVFALVFCMTEDLTIFALHWVWEIGSYFNFVLSYITYLW